MEETLIQLILKAVKNETWESVIFSTKITDSGSSRPGLYLVDKMSNQKYFEPDDIMMLINISDTATINFKEYKNDASKRFNKVEFEIYKDGTYKANYYWDEDEVKKQASDLAEVMPQWINDRLISVLFSKGYGDHESWQMGVFTFKISQQKLHFEGILFNQGVSKKIRPKLPEYVIKGILQHHQITNEGLLSDTWQKWNTLIIRCPHNDIDLDKDVEYRLE